MWTIQMILLWSALVALCSPYPVQISPKQKINEIVQRRNYREHEGGAVEPISLVLGYLDSDADSLMDDHELENMFRTMDSFVDQDTAQYLAWDFLSNGEFELKNDKIPIDDLATYIHDNALFGF